MITLTDKMVFQIRDAIDDCFNTYGTTDHPRFADRLATVVEMCLNLAGDEVPARDPEVKQEPAAVEEEIKTAPCPEEETAEEKPNLPKKSKEYNELHSQIITLQNYGKKVPQIAKELDVSVNTVYNHLKFERDMGAK